MAKLTKAFIDKVQPPAEGYRIHWDETVKGYGLRVTAAGKKVFVAQGRVRGKAVIVTIGPFGLYPEDKGRAKAQRILQDMRDGIDPRDVKKQEEAAKVGDARFEVLDGADLTKCLHRLDDEFRGVGRDLPPGDSGQHLLDLPAD
ncbi:MAG: Arm DNA-binding domain-containing protein [Brevundimonas sp.]|uniref:Arm DNA-binding domain-containing protein n=1 Tax=Brevundimonas sp. TaxID=1871086 RepID=UPI002736F031|nr:Arm DNA-binding domain-containing protein [Brevundimonas sp.]MDP3656258.1 Arm DNA-binding domain-containing protein [Brevundimonas sp.]